MDTLAEGVVALRDIDSDIFLKEELIKELTTAGGCGNISVCRHSNASSSNHKTLVGLDYKGADKVVTTYLQAKLRREIAILQSERYTLIEEFYHKALEGKTINPMDT